MKEEALIFQNLANGVPVQQVCRDFQRSEKQVMDVFSFVLRKIKSYIFTRQVPDWRNYVPGAALHGKPLVTYPTVTGTTIDDVKKQRITCLSVLPKLNLDKPPQFKDIQTEIVTPENAMTIGRNIRA